MGWDNSGMEEVKIIFENSDYLVVDKPAGMVTIKDKQINLEDWIAKKYPNNLLRKGIVHRLDKGTSGLLLVAKNQKYLDFLQRIIKERKVRKTYLALMSGEASFKGSIDMPIGRNGHIFGKFGVKSGGKNALTLFERIGVINFENKKYSLLKIDLKTGRTHQIRVHFAYLGWPLVSDKTYGGPSTGSGLDRPFLHSSEISFVDMEGKEVIYKSGLAIDLKNTLKLIGYDNEFLI